MSILLLVIGYVSDSDARILCEVNVDSIVSVDLNGQIVLNQWITASKPQIIEIDNLSDHTKYDIRIYTDSDERLGSFTTSPSKLHFLSCNNYGKGDHKAWQYMLSQQLPDMIVHLGDVIYLDYGNDCFDRACKQKTYEQMVDIFRAEYRKQWNVSYMKEVLSKCSNVMLFDDHDLVDSFDQKISLPHDWSEKTWDELQSQYVDKEAKAIIAALQCVCEYQLSLCGIDKPRSWSIQVGGKKIGFVETRVARASNSRLVFPECDILVTGVPIFMLPDGVANNFSNGIGRLAKIYDIYDQWNMHKQNMEDAITQLPKISMIIAGDTHAGANSNITLNGRKIKQYVTSGIDTPTPPKLLQYLLYLHKRYKYRYSKGYVQVEHEYWIWHNNYLKLDMQNLDKAEFVVPALL